MTGQQRNANSLFKFLSGPPPPSYVGSIVVKGEGGRGEGERTAWSASSCRHTANRPSDINCIPVFLPSADYDLMPQRLLGPSLNTIMLSLGWFRVYISDLRGYTTLYPSPFQFSTYLRGCPQLTPHPPISQSIQPLPFPCTHIIHLQEVKNLRQCGTIHCSIAVP